MIDIGAKNLELVKLFNMMAQLEIFEDHMIDNPVFRVFSFGCRRINTKMEFAALGKFVRMYREAAQLEHKYEPDSYLHKNLLKNKVEVTIASQKIGCIRS